MRFEGCCSYPHGYAVTLSFFATVAASLAATGYAFASCRFLILSFVSSQDDFVSAMSSDAQTNPTAGDVNRQFRVSAGLYTWSDQGQCVGYRQTMLEELTEPIFEAVRIIAVVAVILSITMLFWIILMTTMSMKPWELGAQRLLLLVLASLTGLSFLVLKSSLCSDDAGDRMSTTCELDQGGLVAIAATILWFVAFLISIVFVNLPGRGDLVLIDGQLQSQFEARQNDRKQMLAFKAMQRERRQEERASARLRQQQSEQDVEAQPSNAGQFRNAVPGAIVVSSVAATAAGVDYVVSQPNDHEGNEERGNEVPAEDIDNQIDTEPETQHPAEAEDDLYLRRTLDNILSICGPHDEVEL